MTPASGETRTTLLANFNAGDVSPKLASSRSPRRDRLQTKVGRLGHVGPLKYTVCSDPLVMLRRSASRERDHQRLSPSYGPLGHFCAGGAKQRVAAMTPASGETRTTLVGSLGCHKRRRRRAASPLRLPWRTRYINIPGGESIRWISAEFGRISEIVRRPSPLEQKPEQPVLPQALDFAQPQSRPGLRSHDSPHTTWLGCFISRMSYLLTLADEPPNDSGRISCGGVLKLHYAQRVVCRAASSVGVSLMDFSGFVLKAGFNEAAIIAFPSPT
jgi:hypothetical protein